jgi:hypothetical protein
MTSGPTPLQVAIHEAGHAVAHLVLNDLPPHQGSSIRSVSVIPTDGVLGVVTTDPRISRFGVHGLAQLHADEAMSQSRRFYARLDIIEALAGPTAELYSTNPLIPLHLIEKMIPEILVDPAHEAGDCANIRRAIEWLGGDDPQALLRRLWEIAYAIVATEWIGIVEVARVLRDRQTMSGDEFEATWRRGRQSEKTRRRRGARLGHPCADWRAMLAFERIQTATQQGIALMPS